MLQVLLLGSSFLLLFAVTEILYHRCQMMAEHTRKIAHIGAGLLCTVVPRLIQNPAWVVVLMVLFCVLLGWTAKAGRLGSIHDVSRGGYGGLLFPLAVGFLYGSFWLSKEVLRFYLPLLILTLADPIAYFVGTRFPWKRYRVPPLRQRYGVRESTKTLSGSLAFFTAALALCTLVTWHHPQWSLAFPRQVLIAVTTTLAEALSTEGYDNLTIPLACTLALLPF